MGEQLARDGEKWREDLPVAVYNIAGIQDSALMLPLKNIQPWAGVRDKGGTAKSTQMNEPLPAGVAGTGPVSCRVLQMVVPTGSGQAWPQGLPFLPWFLHLRNACHVSADSLTFPSCQQDNIWKLL